MSEPKETKCWTCQRGPRSECAWFARHKPVPGWTEERRDVMIQTSTHKRGKFRYYKHYEESYRVVDCPLYLEDRREPERLKWDGPVCMECWSRRVCMETHATCNRRAKC